MNRIIDEIARFMRGRYGYDQLGMFLLFLAFVINIAGMIARAPFLTYASLAVLVLLNIRVFSRNIAARREENEKFLKWTVVPRRSFKAFMLSLKDSGHRYVLCPKCHQICRIEKGRGEGEVVCPKCHTAFAKRS